MDSTYNIVLSTSESTVVTEYVPEKKRSEAYQSEAALENAFIKLLSEQGYEYLQIHNTDALVDNLRKQLERLNKYTFTDKEWDVFYKTDESRSDRISSSGVGLAVVKNILDMHKAKYGCDSGEGGTIFWFSMDTNKSNKKKR